MSQGKLITISAAAKLLSYKSKRTILRLSEQGLLRLVKRRGQWWVADAQVRSARVLTTGRAAKLAGCSAKTVRRRIRDGLVTPEAPEAPSSWMCESATERLSLQDVAAIKKSIQRQRPRRAADPKKKTNNITTTQTAARGRTRAVDQPQLYQDRTGRYWLWWGRRWWKQGNPPNPTTRRPT